MQAVDSNILIKKINEYLDNKQVLIENEIVSLRQKKQIICNQFKLELEQITKCRVIIKHYFDCIVLEIRDINNDLIGFSLDTDRNEKYQFSSVQKQKENSVMVIDRYTIKDDEYNIFVQFCKSNEDENIFIIYPDSQYVSSNYMEELAETRILQAIEKFLGNDQMSIYQIKRKKLSIPKFTHTMDNIINFNDKK